MKVVVRNDSKFAQNLRARVLRPNGPVDTAFHLMPKSTSTLRAVTFLDPVTDGAAMTTRGLTIISVDNSDDGGQALFNQRQSSANGHDIPRTAPVNSAAHQARAARRFADVRDSVNAKVEVPNVTPANKTSQTPAVTAPAAQAPATPAPTPKAAKS